MTDLALHAALNAGFWAAAIPAMFGHALGLRRRTCRKLWVAADLLALTRQALELPGIIAAVFCTFWVVTPAPDIRRLLRDDDDDDDQPKRRRRKLKLRVPDLSGLVLPGVLQPARGAA